MNLCMKGKESPDIKNPSFALLIALERKYFLNFQPDEKWQENWA